MNGTGVTEEAAWPGFAAGTAMVGPHLGLTVYEPTRAAHWWCRTLGFVSISSGDGAGGETRVSQAVIRHPDSGLAVGFRRRPAGLSAAAQVSLRVASHQALDDWAVHLDELSVPHSRVWDNSIGMFLSFMAPDGTGLELWWPHPG